MVKRIAFAVGRRMGRDSTVWLLDPSVRPPIRGPWVLRAIIRRD